MKSPVEIGTRPTPESMMNAPAVDGCGCQAETTCACAATEPDHDHAADMSVPAAPIDVSTRELRASSYVIYVDLPRTEDEMLLVHGYTGAFDKVSGRVARFVRGREDRRAPTTWAQWAAAGGEPKATPEARVEGDGVLDVRTAHVQELREPTRE